jgi:hypothetical protein
MICYDDYPIRIVILNLIELLLALVVGVLLVAQHGWWAVLSYAAVGCLGLVLSLAYGCTRCSYYGRVCGLGLGKIAPALPPARRRRVWAVTLADGGLDPGGIGAGLASGRRVGLARQRFLLVRTGHAVHFSDPDRRCCCDPLAVRLRPLPAGQGQSL